MEGIILTCQYFSFSTLFMISIYFVIRNYMIKNVESFERSIPIYEIEAKHKTTQKENRKKHYKWNQIMRKYYPGYFRFENR